MTATLNAKSATLSYRKSRSRRFRSQICSTRLRSSTDGDASERLVTDFVSGDNRQREPPPFVIIIVVTVPPFDEDMMRIDHLGAIVRTARNRQRGRHRAAVVDSRGVISAPIMSGRV